jgi:predicted regulator of Ras-like GTPase activity (Roadblock/LC7/MglB family)
MEIIKKMSLFVPKALYENEISKVLDEIKYSYGILTRKGFIYGLIAIDQDAKIIAIDSRFDRKLNYWDLSSIGAALFGVARQAQDFFETDSLIRATLIYKDLQLYVKSIGKVELQKKGKREILIVLLVDKDVNIGIIILQMNKFGQMIREAIKRNNDIMDKLEMNEVELKKHLEDMKKKVFESV